MGMWTKSYLFLGISLGRFWDTTDLEPWFFSFTTRYTAEVGHRLEWFVDEGLFSRISASNEK